MENSIIIKPLATVVLIGMLYYVYTTVKSFRNLKRRSESDEEEEEEEVERFFGIVDKPLPDLSTAKRNLELQLRKNWSRKFEETAATKDLTRLARRIQVTVDGEVKVQRDEDVEHDMEKVAAIVSAVAQAPSIAEVNDEVQAKLDSLSSVNARGVPEVHLKELFVNSFGVHSRTTTTFRCIHQGLIMPVAFFLKTATNLMTKDVKDSSGWLVDIEINDTAEVIVTHTRKEISCGTHERELYEIEYKIQFKIANIVSNEPEVAVKVNFILPRRDEKLHPKVQKALLRLQHFNQQAT